jgi:thymidylate synthase (FAD)
MDPRFRVNVISCTPNPQQTIYAALHQDYSEDYVFDQIGTDKWPDERRAGEIALKRILGGELHAGPLEHAQIVFNVGWFPHSVMQQARTHRIASFDVQCLTGDSEVTFLDKNGHFKKTYTLADLYDTWHHGEKAIRKRSIKGRKNEPPGEYRRDAKTRIRKMRVRSLNEESNTFTINYIEEVVFSGINPVFEVTLEDGKKIRCTENHKIYTLDGWKTLKEIKVGDSLMANGVPLRDADKIYQNKEWLEEGFKKGLTTKDLARAAGCSVEAIKKWAYHHKLSWEKKQWNKGIKYTLNISNEERERRRSHAKDLLSKLPRPRDEQHPSWKNLPVEKRVYHWLKRERTRILAEKGGQCSSCGATERLHIHHIQEVKTHPDLAFVEDNLDILCASCHATHHKTGVKNPFCSHPVKVISILFIGNQPTYDLVMKAPHHNFVCNGVVVHNSMRYTGQRIVQCAEGILPVEEVFYLRPEGYYTDRKGHKYQYTEHQRNKDLNLCMEGAARYTELVNSGFAEEHARGILPFDYRQHFVVSMNMRSLGHLLTIRGKKDAQLEIQQMCQLMLPRYEAWAPEIYSWFAAKQWQKGRLAL